MSTFGSVDSIYNNASSGVLPSDTTSFDYKTEFLQLMLVQLKNQDPTDPYDSDKMMQTQAQLAELEQMQNLNTNLVSLMAMENVTQASGMLGKQVAGTNAEGIDVAGTVMGIEFNNGNPIFNVQQADGTVIKISPAYVDAISI
jgi:flagellar basal-body rod modification protein FlgD